MPSAEPAPRIAIVLPPREGFSPDSVGAVGLMVHRLAGAEDLVLGRAGIDAPFAGTRFRGVVPPRWSPLRAALRYAAGVAAILRHAPVDAIEVHNRPDVARSLARRFPRCRVSLFLHNDPQGMRGATQVHNVFGR